MPSTAHPNRPLILTKRDLVWVGRFDAMASPCEVLMAVESKETAELFLRIAAHETWRIEQKFSRYRDDGIIPRINNSGGATIPVDAETAHLIDYAYQCHQLSDGLFDVTSGILRKTWPFRPNSTIPTNKEVDALLPFIGLDKATWNNPDFRLPSDMQIDFGGIGKEYAVDRTLALLTAKTNSPIMVNYGGDITCNRSPSPNTPWRVGIENSKEMIELTSGSLATSGSTHRYLMYDGKRYSHVLNPKTGWPIENAPLSVTVKGDSCTHAGMLATFAMLKGKDAESFLEAQNVFYRILR